MKIDILQTKTVPTAKCLVDSNEIVYIHSRYNPLKEAKNWFDFWNNEIRSRYIVIWGIGLGYHVQLFAEAYPEVEIIVVEVNNDYFNWFKGTEFYQEIISFKNIKLTNYMNFAKLLIEEDAYITVYQPSLKLFPSNLKSVRELLEDYVMKYRTIVEQKDLLDSNFSLNINLKDKELESNDIDFKDKKVILVSAGPSLIKQLVLLKKLKGNPKYIIVCVGTALFPLINEGIVPDVVMISDPKEQIIDQFSGIDTKNLRLFYLATANHLAVSNFQGQRYIVFQKGYSLSERYAEENRKLTINTGGSVSTSLLDTVVKMGAKIVALVGQDLAHTDNQTHAIGTHLYQKVNHVENYKKIENYHRNGTVYTTKNLSIYRKWFEKYADENNHLELCNCTEGGWYINGWVHISLNEFINKIN
jgi:hypothetical protein